MAIWMHSAFRFGLKGFKSFGMGGPQRPCGNFNTLVDAVSNGGVKVEGLAGVPSVLSEDQSGIQEAVELAGKVDTVLLEQDFDSF